VKTNGTGRRCSATNRYGERCRNVVVNAAGYCSVHDPESKVDMRELGKASARARARPNPDRVHPSLRDFLRSDVPPAVVWAAIQAALEGGSDAARVSASRLLVDALHEPSEQQDWRKQMASEMQTAAAEFDRKIELRARVNRAHRREQLADILEPIGLAELVDEDELEVVRALAGRLAAIPEPIRS
jgi:hypothetical protein